MVYVNAILHCHIQLYCYNFTSGGKIYVEFLKMRTTFLPLIAYKISIPKIKFQLYYKILNSWNEPQYISKYNSIDV